MLMCKPLKSKTIGPINLKTKKLITFVKIKNSLITIVTYFRNKRNLPIYNNNKIHQKSGYIMF